MAAFAQSMPPCTPHVSSYNALEHTHFPIFSFPSIIFFSSLHHWLILEFVVIFFVFERAPETSSRAHCIKTSWPWNLMFGARQRDYHFRSHSHFSRFSRRRQQRRRRRRPAVSHSSSPTCHRHFDCIHFIGGHSHCRSRWNTKKTHDTEYNSFRRCWGMSRRYLCHFIHEIYVSSGSCCRMYGHRKWQRNRQSSFIFFFIFFLFVLMNFGAFKMLETG